MEPWTYKSSDGSTTQTYWVAMRPNKVGGGTIGSTAGTNNQSRIDVSSEAVEPLDLSPEVPLTMYSSFLGQLTVDPGT